MGWLDVLLDATTEPAQRPRHRRSGRHIAGTGPNDRKVPDVTSALATSPLKATDRCDSCGAQAYIRAILPDGELLFCGHHGRKHEAKLRPLTVEWQDETSKLTEKVVEPED